MLSQNAHRFSSPTLVSTPLMSGTPPEVSLNNISIPPLTVSHGYHGGVMLIAFVWLLMSSEMAKSRKAEEKDAMKAALSNDGFAEKK